jgi:hypothetical protein
MSDLTGKFSGLGEQLTANHEEIMSALDTIATALGAPPPDPTTTLADLLTAITETNTLLAGIRTDMNDQLTAIFNTVDTINNNASLNAQRLISVLLQTACPCDDTVPVLPPDLGTTPIDATDIAKCQRIQYFIDLFRSWTVNVAAAIGGAGSISSFQINNLLQLTLLDVDITTGDLTSMATSTRDGIVGQIASAIGASSASAINTGLFTAITDSGNLEAMRQALYGVTTAADGKAAIDSAIDDLGLDPLIGGILKSMFYSAWPNDIYSDVPVVDASAYDGEICVPPLEAACATNTTFTTSEGQIQAQWLNTTLAPYCVDSGDLNSPLLSLTLASYEITIVDAGGLIHVTQFGGAPGFIDTEPPCTVDSSTGYTEFYILSGTSFHVEVCATPAEL